MLIRFGKFDIEIVVHGAITHSRGKPDGLNCRNGAFRRDLWQGKYAALRIDLVEVAPDYDPTSSTAILGAQILMNLLGFIFHAGNG